MARQTTKYANLLYYVSLALLLLGCVEYFKYSTRTNYEWFHCTPVMEPANESGSVKKLYAVGGPACDKRGEFKSIFNFITSNYDPNVESYSFCFVENTSLKSIHYPISNHDKGPAGYLAYIGYDSDKELVQHYCDGAGATVFHL
ncbi:sphingosine N-acyltransferase subunit LIP1 Ecym_5643 [Eremothecium cymbalariae DBVPG|uniref:Ceramide synthase subunit LIP1 n=1 Tax=Eremothecium cymbalariae (strain CBS 270.75 / DBVPG 7215 / KCTC 17166 / NRRL Y-17582) TaxID=931890 RepID=I6NE86_ERECY|nr:hypothetical protein Ecym_5643 [Eremothecium cymbalariae DBVPG\